MSYDLNADEVFELAEQIEKTGQGFTGKWPKAYQMP